MANQSNIATKNSGRGEVEVRDFGQSCTKITSLFSAYPLRLMSPRLAPNSRAVMIFILTYGGGLVAGDETNLRIQVLENARLGLLTQGNTKIYKTKSDDTRTTLQTLTATIRENGALLLLPDPVSPFADSVYEQRQIFEMDHTTSSLLLLDWLTEGRSARGEAWSFAKWKGSNEIWSLPECESDAKSTEQRLLLRDNIKLDSGSSKSVERLRDRMEGLGVFGILIIAGPLFQTLGKFFLDKHDARPRIGEKDWSSRGSPNGIDEQQSHGSKQDFDPSLKWTATSTRQFVVVRFGARAVENARQWLRELLIQDGTVEREFGPQYLRCLQDR